MVLQKFYRNLRLVARWLSPLPRFFRSPNMEESSPIQAVWTRLSQFGSSPQVRVEYEQKNETTNFRKPSIFLGT